MVSGEKLGFRPWTREEMEKLVKILAGDPDEELGVLEEVRLVESRDSDPHPR